MPQAPQSKSALPDSGVVKKNTCQITLSKIRQDHNDLIGKGFQGNRSEGCHRTGIADRVSLQR
jgi:hypothetical protein